MKKTITLIFSIFALVSCNDNKADKLYLPESSGRINNLTVVMDNQSWEGQIGEAIRLNFAATTDGLPQIEPLFTISQMPPEAFEGFVRRSRNFLRIDKGEPAGVNIAEDAYARPQTGVFISGQTNDTIIELINKRAEEIITVFKESEIKENQRRISQSLEDDSRLEEELGISLDFPTSYRYAKEAEDFFWIRKDIPDGSMEILVYEVPLDYFEQDTSVVANIIQMRDSIGEAYIPGPVEDSHMITEAAYAPYLYEAEIDGKFAYETRGTWEVTNFFMAGPFLNYAVRDEENDRYVILEGFAFAPSAPKRDKMFELEAILRSAEIN